MIQLFFVNYKKNFFISRIKTNLKCYKSISERYAIYEQLELEELLSQSKDSIGTEKYNKLKVCLVGVKLSDDIATKCIRKAIIQNNGADIDVYKCQFLHWNLMITNINRETFNASIITELYRMRWQIELLFKVLKKYTFYR